MADGRDSTNPRTHHDAVTLRVSGGKVKPRVIDCFLCSTKAKKRYTINAFRFSFIHDRIRSPVFDCSTDGDRPAFVARKIRGIDGGDPGSLGLHRIPGILSVVSDIGQCANAGNDDTMTSVGTHSGK